MSDPFLDEIRRIHRLRRDIRALPKDVAEERLPALLGPGAEKDWALIARDGQIPPEDLDWCYFLCAGRGYGKMLALDTPLPTPDGWTTMGAVGVGDTVFDEAGRSCRVTAKFEPRVDEQYRVTFSDGSTIDACGDHQWVTWTRAERKSFLRSPYERDLTRFPADWPRWRLRRIVGGQTDPVLIERGLLLVLRGGLSVHAAAREVGIGWNTLAPHVRAGALLPLRGPVVYPDSPGPQIRTTRQIRETLTYGRRGDLNHCIPNAMPLDLPERPLSLDAWLLGYWIGNGSLGRPHVTAGSWQGEMDADYVCSQIEAAGYGYRRTDRPEHGHSGIDLRDFPVPDDRRIPSEYLRASIEQRLALVRGLMDSDGHPGGKHQQVEFSTIRRELADQVYELVVSLGERCTLSEGDATLNGRVVSKKYRITWRPSLFNPFSLPRKARHVAPPGAQGLRLRHRMIVSVEPIAPVPMACITVDSPNAMYLAGRSMIPTHNTRTLSAMVHIAVRAGLRYLHFIAPTTSDYTKVNVSGPSGILATHGRDPRPRWLPTLRTLRWPNGAECLFFSGEEPDSLRGPESEMCVAAGEPVTMADGSYKPIEQVAIGDMVETAIGPRRVRWRGLTREDAETVTVHTDRTSVRLTPDHRVYDIDRGWIEAATLKPGDRVVTYGPEPRTIDARVERVEPAGRTDCYDITVVEAFSFFAGGILVHNCIIDEIGKMKYQQDVFDTMMMGNRIGAFPRVIIGSTPKATKFFRSLITMPGIRIATGTTYDNSRNLPASFINKMRDVYEGTRLGRQELGGELVLEPEDAVFLDKWITVADIPDEMIEQTSVGVDPSGGQDHVGIIVAALLKDGTYAVLADRSIAGTPGQWGEAVVRAYDDFDCDDVVVETNYGGAMAADVIKQAAKRLHEDEETRRPTDIIVIREVRASHGKAVRAEPIALLYEKGRVGHRKGLDQLEAEMTTFDRNWDDKQASPNRMDASVWALTRLSKVITEIPVA